ncbi:MAG: hypothetical protein ACD_58C00131G0014 [uncultured bacterium]|nr:MAG: hypothetical protein ACD_58C00131G0014 [uncultured bacterium]
MSNYIVIMAGGVGTRLWPLSRKSSPKQLQTFVGNQSMIQETFDRVKEIVPVVNILISTNNRYKTQIMKQLPEIPENNYILEPVSRNTAPAMGLIASYIIKRDSDAVITTLASDHLVNNKENFVSVIKAAFEVIDKNPEYINTIGLKPTFAHTGLGYIEKSEKLKMKNEKLLNNVEVYNIKQFVEKPNLETAQKYVDSGNFFWNASYFTWQAKNLLDIIKLHQPDIYIHLEKIIKAIGTDQENQVITDEFNLMPDLAIDYIVEQLDKVSLIPADLGWDDIGSWQVLQEIMANLSGKNVIERGNHIGLDNKNCLVYAQDKLIATVGLEDVIIVDTPNATLICHKNRSQDVKKIIDKLKEKGLEEYL